MVGVALFPPGIPMVGYPGAAVQEKERLPGLELVDLDASRLTRAERTGKVFVADVAPPGPVITIVIPVGGGVVPLPPGAVGSTVAANGPVSQGVKTTDPLVFGHPGDAGPPRQPHQFCGAFTVPAPPLKTPVTAVKLLSVADTSPPGAVKATARDSWLIRFCEITVPLTGARLWILIPVGPDVAVSSTSAPFWEMVFPTITLSSKSTAGAPAGAAWLCIATPGSPLLMITLLTT